MKISAAKILLACIVALPTIGSAATYSVPVPSNLEKFASFSIPNPKVVVDGNLTTVKYRLPPELVGKNFPEVSLVTEDFGDDHYRSGSPLANADCRRKDDLRTCKITMKNIHINQDAAERFILDTTPNPTDAKNKIQVMRIFAFDPVGILTY
ncbi:MAG: hypothetical protein EOP06_19325 [Proteobacteria bacterium]|nr:MAG: hypothetical protein EOP06_19325 [Pseudomonadota bacterium]